MGYQECYKETNELAAERYELVAERIAEIARRRRRPEPFGGVFPDKCRIFTEAFVHCMKKEKAAVLRRGAWRK